MTNPTTHHQIHQTSTNLRWITNHYQEITNHLAPGRGPGQTHRSKPDSRPPLNTNALSLAQRGGIAGVLTEWVKIVVEERKVNPPNPRLADGPYFYATATIINNHLDWFADDETRWPELRGEIRQLKRDLERTLGLINEAPIPGDNKSCVRDIEPDIPCGGDLIQDYDLDIIYCRQCRTTWDKSQWLLLGRMLRVAAQETPDHMADNDQDAPATA